MNTHLELLLAPAEVDLLGQRDLSGAVCVVFDVLRATSTIVTALGRGARAVVPVEDIPRALAIKRDRPDVLLAGERNGLRIRANLTGGVEFDLGNSPREFTADRVRGRTIVMTTTNGTRALRASAGAQRVLVGCLLNLGALVADLERTRPPHLILVCSGTLDQAAWEDVLAAGALCERLWPRYGQGAYSDGVLVGRGLYGLHAKNLAAALALGRNGRRLAARAELADDVAYCARQNAFHFVPALNADQEVRWLPSTSSDESTDD